MLVPSGTVLTWIGTFSDWSFDTVSLDDGISAVSVYLKNNYNLVVTNYNDDLADDSSGGTVTLSIQTGMDRGNSGSDDGVLDIKGNVDDAFAVAIKSFGAGIDLASSTCVAPSITPVSAPGPTYSFSFRNLLPSWLGGTPVTPDQQAQYTAQGQAQIKTVATNAAAAYGASSTTATVAAATASSQSTAYVTDESKLAAAQIKDAASSDNMLKYGLIAAGVVIVAIVALPYISAARSAAA